MSEGKRRGDCGGFEGFPDNIKVLSPTDKWGTKTEYARLRKFLLKDGYIRIGPEVFMRVVQNRKASEKHYRRIDEVKPKTGVVRLLRPIYSMIGCMKYKM